MRKIILGASLCALALLTLVAVSKHNPENTTTLTADFITGDTGIASINALSFGPEGILFVGDSKSDYERAQNFDCNFILVLTGKGLKTLEQLASKTLIVEKSLQSTSEGVFNGLLQKQV